MQTLLKQEPYEHRHLEGGQTLTHHSVELLNHQYRLAQVNVLTEVASKVHSSAACTTHWQRCPGYQQLEVTTYRTMAIGS